jgi:ubiquinone/menaquinone biosynthesis C-methylase UbiE
MKGVAKLYRKRFPEADRAGRQALWQTLCRAFFQRYVPPDGHVLDLGAGYCEFINAIQAARKTAVDLNPDTGECAAAGVTVLQASADKLTAVPDASVDVVFASNFFEHLDSKETLLRCLAELRRVLKPAGRLLILQPNIRYAPGEFWDFFDHHLPLSDRSMIEALEISGFGVAEVRPRFLPMTTKSRLPQWSWLVSLYLRLRIVQRLLGKQMLIVAHPMPAQSDSRA